MSLRQELNYNTLLGFLAGLRISGNKEVGVRMFNRTQRQDVPFIKFMTNHLMNTMDFLFIGLSGDLSYKTVF